MSRAIYLWRETCPRGTSNHLELSNLRILRLPTPLAIALRQRRAQTGRWRLCLISPKQIYKDSHYVASKLTQIFFP